MTTPAVEVRNLSMRFDVSAPWLARVLTRTPRSVVHALEDITLTIDKGATFALVGESGCGKSTFARVLAGLYAPTSGSVRIFGIDPARAGKEERRELTRRVNMIFQDPYASLNPRWRVKDILAEPILTQEGRASGLDKRVREVLELVRMPASSLDKYPHQFSGGQRQRISIARALATRPEFLILDEPTSALDVSVQAQVLNIMREIQRERGITYLIISHNLAVVHHMSDEIGVMYLGRLVEKADKQTLFSAPAHPYTKMLLAAIPEVGPARQTSVAVTGEVPSPIHPPAGCAFHPRCPHACAQCAQRVPAMRETAPGHFAACFDERS